MSASVPAIAEIRRPEAFDPREESISECGTELSETDIAAFLERLQSQQDDSQLVTVEPPYFIAFAPHIVRRTDGTGGLPASQYEQAVADANVHFVDTQIVFYSLPIDYIDSDAFYFNINTMAEINALRTTNQVPNAINVYFTENLASEGGALCGISAFTSSPVQAIAVKNSCTATQTNHSTFSHEIGHFFNLFHTHETAFGAEFVNGSNCSTAGDLLCDTPADPQLTTSTVNETTCDYIGMEIDLNGDFYAPDSRQLMSFSLKHCRNTFTTESIARIVATLLGDRLDLFQNEVDVAERSPSVAARIELLPPRPNPMGERVELVFNLERAGFVELTIHDVRGAVVNRRESRFRNAGEHAVSWDGVDAAGRLAAPGIYFARLEVGGRAVTQKIQIVR
jgi:hypothetical protein